MTPEEPWPYTELIIEELPDAPAARNGGNGGGVLEDEAAGAEQQLLALVDAEVAMASPSAFLPEIPATERGEEGETGYEPSAPAQSRESRGSRQQTGRSNKPRSRGGGSLVARVRERRRASGEEQMEQDSAGSASEHSRATTPAGELGGSASPSRSGRWCAGPGCVRIRVPCDATMGPSLRRACNSGANG